MCTCDSLLPTAQARLKRQRRSTSQDWLGGSMQFKELGSQRIIDGVAIHGRNFRRAL